MSGGLRIARAFDLPPGAATKVAAALDLRLDEAERLVARFVSHTQWAPEGCWIWTGYRRHSYGALSIRGRPFYAHRLSYLVYRGHLPAVVRHRCDIPLCVHPDDLLGGTQADNVADAVARGRAVAPPVLRGLTNPRARLTDAEVEAIRAREGEDQRALAAEFGCSQSTIWRLLRREVRA